MVSDLKAAIAFCLIGATCCFGTPLVLTQHAFGLSSSFSERGLLDAGVEFNDEQKKEISQLISEGGLYRLRLNGEAGVTSAVNACDLYKAGFKEEVSLYIGKDGSIVGIDYVSPLGVLGASRDCSKVRLPEKLIIQTTVKVNTISKAQSVPVQVLAATAPPGLQHLQQKDTASTGPEKPATPMDYFKRYWYIIIPAFLVLTMTGSPPAAEQGQPQAAAPAAK